MYKEYCKEVVDTQKAKTMKKLVLITGEKEKEILAYFKSAKDNRVATVAAHFGVSAHQVNRIVDVDIDKTRLKLYESYKSTK